MTREEMIAMAKETRKQVTNAPVPPELLAQFPVTMTEITIPTSLGDCKAYLSTTERIAPGGPLLINLHGGGFIQCRRANDEVFCRRMTCDMDMKVLDIDYPVAPDYPFPTALYESYDAVKWAFDHAAELEINPSRVCLMGHSAGGNLVCGIQMLAQQRGDFRIALAVLDYPPLDLKTDPADKPNRGTGIPPERGRLYNLYYRDDDQADDPLVSPVFASEEQLSSFAKTLVITAGLDSLCEEAEGFALRLGQAGVEVTLKRFPDNGHAFVIYRRGDYLEATKLIQRFIRQNL